MHPLQDSWDRTARHLREAEQALAGRQHPALAEFHDWLAHNELELALDALEAAGVALDAPAPFWRALAAAAAEMQLAGHAARYAAALAGDGERGGV